MEFILSDQTIKLKNLLKINKLRIKKMKTNITILVLILISIGSLNATIIYRNIDSTISATSQEKQISYMLDMNGDGINDFCLKHINNGYYECGISGTQVDSGEIQVNQNLTVYMCALNQLITEVAFDSPENMYYGMGVMDVDWLSGHENILAVRFQINSLYHYGWIKVVVPANNSYLKIVDCAYEDTPGTGIPAGRQSNSIIDNNPIDGFDSYSIYPNPARDFITINGCKNEIIEIFSSLGIKLCELRNHDKIDINNLKSGFYMIKINNKTYKFIKK
jgi:hypothetical protein